MAQPPAWMLPDFEPQKAKIPELRNILLENNVHHSVSRKAELIDLFEAKVRPRAPTLLQQYRNVQPSANGIIDAKTGQQIEEPPPSPQKRGRGRPRKTAPQLPEDEAAFGDAEEMDPTSPRPRVKAKAKSSTARKSQSVAAGLSKAAIESDAEEEITSPAPPRKRGRPPKTPRKTDAPAAQTPSHILPRSTTQVLLQQGEGEDALAAIDEHAQSMMRQKAKGEASSVKRKKSVDAKTEEDVGISEVEAPKEKRRKKQPGDKSRRASGLDSGPESGFSDFNPFQSGAEDSPEVKEKKPRRKSSLGDAPRRTSMVPSGLPKSATTGDVKLDTKSSRPSTGRHSLGGDPRDHVVFGTPSSAPRMSLPAMPTPNRAAQFVGQRHMARLSDRPPAVDTPEQVARELVPDPDFGVDQADDLSQAYVAQPGSSSPSAPVQARKALAPITKQRPSLSELAQTATQSPKRVIVKVTQTPKGQRSFSPAALASQLLFLSLLFGGYGWWRHEKLALGFCDTGRSSNALTRDARGAEYLRFGCTSCPSHGACDSSRFLGCDSDYVPKENPLSLGGLVPVAPKCVPDTEKLVKIAEEAAGVAKVLRKRRGEVICKGEWSGKGLAAQNEARTYGLPEDKLRAAAATGRKSSYGDLFELALDDLEAHGEIIKGIDARGASYFASHSADLSLACRAKLGAIAWAKRQQMVLASIAAAVWLLFYIRWKMQTAREQDERVRELVAEVFERLNRQAQAHAFDPAVTPEPYLAPAQLRDSILVDHHSAAVRKQLWRGVEKVVEGNSNVRTRQAEHRGENIRVWEWIGSWSDSPRKSIAGSAPGSNKRVSFGGAISHEDSPSLYPSLRQ